MRQQGISKRNGSELLHGCYIVRPDQVTRKDRICRGTSWTVFPSSTDQLCAPRKETEHRHRGKINDKDMQWGESVVEFSNVPVNWSWFHKFIKQDVALKEEFFNSQIPFISYDLDKFHLVSNTRHQCTSCKTSEGNETHLCFRESKESSESVLQDMRWTSDLHSTARENSKYDISSGRHRLAQYTKETQVNFSWYPVTVHCQKWIESRASIHYGYKSLQLQLKTVDFCQFK